LHAELDEGNQVISVDAEPEAAEEAVRILQEHDGEFIWRLGTWTYTRVGE
jgi:predicted O-methyltransferase YrrM